MKRAVKYCEKQMIEGFDALFEDLHKKGEAEELIFDRMELRKRDLLNLYQEERRAGNLTLELDCMKNPNLIDHIVRELQTASQTQTATQTATQTEASFSFNADESLDKASTQMNCSFNARGS